MIAHHRFEIAPYSRIAPVVDAVGVQEKDVSRIDQRDLGNIRVARRPLPEVHREIPLPVWVIFRNFQPERKELYHSASVDLQECSPRRAE
jgi:hypothetical protein